MSDHQTPQWDRWDPVLYDEKHAFVWRYGEELIGLLAPLPGERILDLGCGTGHLTARIAESGAHVVGIDPSPAMLEQARRLYPTLFFELIAAEDYAPEEMFDAVFANAVIHWIKEPEGLIAAVRRLLKPGGRFVAEFGGCRNLTKVLNALETVHVEVMGSSFESPWYFPGIGEYTGHLDRGVLETEYARHIDRPTPIEGEHRLREWMRMYLPDILGRMSVDQREWFISGVENQLRPIIFCDGKWVLDHRRLRLLAQRLI